jgi:colanic acid/amylovoran biosynthesis glycosyltransferase
MIRLDEKPAAVRTRHLAQPASLRIAYLVNQYPKVSHTFIRREILELEQQGATVLRYAMRGFEGVLVDAADTLERRRTHYLLAGGLAALAWEVFCTAVRRPGRFCKALLATVRLGARADRPFPYHLLYLAQACRLARWLHRDRIVHLHAHFGTNSTEVALLAGLLGKVPYSFTVHGPEEFDKPAALHLAEKIHHAAFVIAVSSFGRSQLCRLVPYHQWDKIGIVHCGLSFATIPSRATHGTPPNRIVCVGRLCEQKGQLLLIDAVRELMAKGIDVELILAGDGDMRPAIEAHIRRHRLEAVVRITGWIGAEQIRHEILQAKALVLPSFAEGLPVALMEAMALERPVVTTWVAGIPELVTHRETGWLVPPGDVGALVTALAELFHTPPERLMEMGKRGRQAVQTRHDIAAEVATLLTLILASGRASMRHG